MINFFSVKIRPVIEGLIERSALLRIQTRIFAQRKIEIPVVVSMTSYPPRILTASVAIESILTQTVRPKKFVLFLNDEEFPERKLPPKVLRQQSRGLRIVWLSKNGRSFDKLLPAMRLFPGIPVITVDDDKVFPRLMLADIFAEHIKNPGCVIATRGWKMKLSTSAGAIHYGHGWYRAKAGDKGLDLFTPGGNGCLYPPGCFPEMAMNSGTALEICPTADDIWFWAATQKTKTQSVCLGYPAHAPVRATQGTIALSSTNLVENEPQLQRVLDHFGIRREVLARLAAHQTQKGC